MNERQSPRPPTTTDAGIPVASQEHSLTVGPDGPILLQDFYLIEQMANFNRERIPERQPHAKGGGAFGTFVVTDDVSPYTKAAVFQPGTETEVVVRFSTVAGERGSPDTWRDPRGFAVRFYTSEGNLDIVGNNTPVFFIRDPMKFQNFIRSQKRLAANNLRDPDMQWDFWTLSPESAHQVTWLMGDRGIPRSWRHMNGYSSHTYMWVNARARRFWVKYHFKTDQGIETLTQADADRIAGEDADYHQRDLYDAIERGEFPSWSLKMQIMPFDQAKSYRFNPFDLTKVWPHGDYPLIDVGRLTLEPQRHRLPHRDGAGRVPAQQHRARHRTLARQDAARPGVLLRRRAPSSARRQLPADPGQPPAARRCAATPRTGPCASTTSPTPCTTPTRFDDAPAADENTYAEHAVWAADGEMVRAAYTLHPEDDDFGQANTLINDVMDDSQRERLVNNVAGALSRHQTRGGAARAFEYWRNIDQTIGDEIEAATNTRQPACPSRRSDRRTTR